MRGSDNPAPFALLNVAEKSNAQAEPAQHSSTARYDQGPLLQVDKLTTQFDIASGLFGRVSHRVHAVEQVSFDLYPGETLGVVGESGCGKTRSEEQTSELPSLMRT